MDLTTHESYEGTATVVQDGESFAIYCDYETTVDPRSGLKSWAGVYQASEESRWPDVGDATLRLPDGAEGHVIITAAAMHPSPRGGVFTGTGEPPTLPST